ncbi:SAM-dependent methyltransferase [Methanolinea mesophila]|uniref:class I SAM-dependent methyltransferase n=1 Tax=Methanolinea mesophila TaxID=547055 RepID=UPI001AE37F14|nr:class I SAM-dependent methyltransferase [Methanolinea mesophila]MBP1928443.1 SAM-dependent methyltransferase [Methanolinea mesophila]
MPPFRDAWDTGYRTRGRVWGGSPGLVPELPAEGRILELGCGDGKTLSFLVAAPAISQADTPVSTTAPPSEYPELGQDRELRAPAGELPRSPLLKGDQIPVTMVSNGNPVEIVGADFSREALRLCRARSTFRSVRFVAADARCLPFRDGIFSLVLMLHVAGHVTKRGREAVAREASRVLTPEGELYFAGFARGDMREGKGPEIEPHTFRRNDGTITHYFTEDEVRELFSSLDPVRVETRKWELRVRGLSHPRAEINAYFKKD